MSKKDLCINNKSFAYYSGFGGLEFKHIEYGIEDHIYFVANAWYGKKSYHKAKIYYNENDTYIMFKGSKISFNDVIRM